METLTRILAISIGGAFGALARYGLNVLFAKSFSPFPFATFFINVTGSFLVGFLLTLFSEKFDVNENLRLAIIVGFLGAYTTFSTFEFETFALMREKHLTTAILYVSMSFAIGLLGVF
ncbi:MAG TPA: fluoride efflux transporter CrcB, partial [Pyrinomonadaceae bacterium]